MQQAGGPSRRTLPTRPLAPAAAGPLLRSLLRSRMLEVRCYGAWARLATPGGNGWVHPSRTELEGPVGVHFEDGRVLAVAPGIDQGLLVWLDRDYGGLAAGATPLDEDAGLYVVEAARHAGHSDWQGAMLTGVAVLRRRLARGRRDIPPQVRPVCQEPGLCFDLDDERRMIVMTADGRHRALSVTEGAWIDWTLLSVRHLSRAGGAPGKAGPSIR